MRSQETSHVKQQLFRGITGENVYGYPVYLLPGCRVNDRNGNDVINTLRPGDTYVNWVIIGSGNGLLPVRLQAITRIKADNRSKDKARQSLLNVGFGKKQL